MTKTNEHLHYLNVLRDNSGPMQPEIRQAIEFAIDKVVNNHDIYVDNRRRLVKEMHRLLVARDGLSKEVNRIRKELKVLDNMIL